MSEISEERAREAARIFRNAVEWTKEYGERPALSDAAKRVMDSATHASAVMSKWAIEELSRRDAAQAARQQPITPEWCLTNGAHRSAEWYWFDDGVSIRPIAGGKWLVVVNSRMLDWSAECVGQVEDLRKALRGGV